MKILLVEDDIQTATLLVKALTIHHYQMDTARDGQAGWELARAYPYDLIMLDVMLPTLDGIELCRRLRTGGNQSPILLLTAKDSVNDRLIGLGAGADDYMVKPFDLSELLARIRALLRRGNAILPTLLTWEKLQLNPDSNEVFYAEKLLRLTPKEYGLLELFLRQPQRIFSRTALLERIWTLDEFPGEAAVTTQIKGLRQKLKAAGMTNDPIETLYGLGYRLRTAPDAEKDCASDAVAKGFAAEVRTETHQKHTNLENTNQKDAKNTNSDNSSLPALAIEPAAVPQQAAADPAKAKVVAVVTALWENFKTSFAERIALFEQAIDQLASGTIDEALQQAIRAEAHRLIGSLGSFGLSPGSQIAREIEQLLQTESLQGQADAYQLFQLVQALQQAIAQKPCFPSIASPPPFSRLLLIDDNPWIADQLQREASGWGFQVEVAPNLSVARLKIATQSPDAILLELNFPTTAESGLTLLAELANQQSTIPVLVFTSQNRLSDRVEVARLGGQRFLHKSASPEQVFKAVTQVLRQTQTVDARVMVVDDDHFLLAQLRNLLQPWGFDVTTLEDPNRFWDVLETVVPDLLILDIEMPGFSGIELCQVVRTDPQWSQIPILFLSAHTDADTLHRVFTVGADDYITKPIREPELMARVLNRLERVQILRRLAETKGHHYQSGQTAE